MMSIIYTMIGVPGSGKSTVAKEECINCEIISTDEIREELFGDASVQTDGQKVFQIAYSRIEKALKENRDVVFDATNISKKYRKKILSYPAEHIAIFCNTPIEECIERNNKRTRVVPIDVIERMAAHLQPPTFDEGFSEIWYTQE